MSLYDVSIESRTGLRREQGDESGSSDWEIGDRVDGRVAGMNVRDPWSGVR